MHDRSSNKEQPRGCSKIDRLRRVGSLLGPRFHVHAFAFGKHENTATSSLSHMQCNGVCLINVRNNNGEYHGPIFPFQTILMLDQSGARWRRPASNPTSHTRCSNLFYQLDDQYRRVVVCACACAERRGAQDRDNASDATQLIPYGFC